MKHIESRPSKNNKQDYDFYVDIDENVTKEENIKLLVEDLKVKAKSVVLHHEESGDSCVIKITSILFILFHSFAVLSDQNLSTPFF